MKKISSLCQLSEQLRLIYSSKSSSTMAYNELIQNLINDKNQRGLFMTKGK